MTLSGKEFGAGAMREAPKPLEVVKLRSKVQIEATLDELKEAEPETHNLLNERSMIEKMFSREGEWRATVESKVLNPGGAAFAFKEEGKTVGFVLVEPDGVIVQFRSLKGKEDDVLSMALWALKDNGFQHPDARLSEPSEDMRDRLHKKGFEGDEKDEGGKIIMEKKV